MQNKRIYIKPVLESETFVPQNYIAACGDTEYGKYLFTCDAPGGNLYYYNRRGRAQYLGSYTPCNRKHEAPMSDEFPNGFIDYNNNGKEDEGEAVKLWLETWHGYILNGHTTKNLNQDSWTVVKS